MSIPFGSRISRLELRHLQAAVAVAEDGGFVPAARRLGIAQPLLSTLIQNLEAGVGTSVFRRRPRVEPTLAGLRLLDAFRSTLEHVERGVCEAQRIGAGEVGALAIGFPTWVLATFVPDAVQEHRVRRPDVRLALQDLPSNAQLQGLLSGALDVAFLRFAPRDPGILHEQLSCEPFCVVAPKAHPIARGSSTSLSALQDQPFIGFPRSAAPGLHEQIGGMLVRSGTKPWTVQEAVDWLTVLALVRAGVGVSIAPLSLRRLWSDGVAFIGIDDAGTEARTFLCWRSRPEKLVSEFLDTVRATRDAGSAKASGI